MLERGKKGFQAVKKAAEKATASVDVNTAKEKVRNAADVLGDKAEGVKDAAMSIKGDITDKLTELDRMLASSITEYNDSYTQMNDKGVQLFLERSRAVDTIQLVEVLVNSIANSPKSFEADFEAIEINRKQFQDTCEFGRQELEAARAAASSAGAGLAAGASVAFMAPTAAMWVATTFGTASTGAAISTLSGAAASNAALDWLGGGALSVGGGGMAAGNALLAMAGPVGWTIAGATLLASILLFTSKRTKVNKQKNEEIEAVKENIHRVKQIDAQISLLLEETRSIRNGLNEACSQCLGLFQGDYTSFTDAQKQSLGALVNHTRTLSALFVRTIG